LTIKRIGEAGNLNSKEFIARLPELKSLATVAKKEHLTVKPEAVEKVGNKLVAAGTPDAWNIALDFVNYKSFLNTSLALSISNLAGQKKGPTLYFPTVPPGMKGPQFSVVGAVPTEKAAQFIEIGKPDPNTSLPVGDEWIIVENGSVALDNTKLRKVVFRNIDVFYDGGPLIMKDVYFMNCVFHISHQPNGRSLAVATLNPSPATTFSAS
jgi:hypothetical protein